MSEEPFRLDDMDVKDPDAARWAAPPHGGAGTPRGTVKSIELRWHGEQDPNADRAWLVRHLIFETGKGLMGGQWGAGKTFGALDLSASVMTGRPFANRNVVRRGGVLFVAPEGAFEIPIRLRGVVDGKLRATGVGEVMDLERLPFAWIEECPPLTRPGSLDVLTKTAQAAAEALHDRFGVSLALIIIDTIAAGAGFEDENSASETQRVMNAMGALSQSTGAFVLGIDHFGKDTATGIRGSSAKEAAADVVLAMMAKRGEAGEISETRMAVRKVRGARCGYEIPYELEVVTVGQDREGVDITTCAVIWREGTGERAATVAKSLWTGSLRVLRKALALGLAEESERIWPFGASGPEVLAVKEPRVRTEFVAAYPADSGTEEQRAETKKRTYRRVLRQAVDRGLIVSRQMGEIDYLWLAEDADAKPTR